MYDELVKELRDSAEWEDRLALLHAPVMREAADAIEELQKRVPKRPHGRLIDADAFESIKYELPDGQKAFNRGFHGGVQYVQRLIMDAPTIIPAEEGE